MNCERGGDWPVYCLQSLTMSHGPAEDAVIPFPYRVRLCLLSFLCVLGIRWLDCEDASVFVIQIYR